MESCKMEKTKILIVEDDSGISSFVKAELLHEGFDAQVSADGEDALKKFQNEEFDIILLDIMLPAMNGIDVLKKIRETSNVPVIMLTALSQIEDKVTGLDCGADDYLTKPFAIEELFARIRVILRRNTVLKNIQKENNNAQKSELVLTIKDVTMNLENMSVTVAGKKQVFSKTEFFMLKYFIENIGKVLTRKNIIDAVWGKDHCIEENAVDVYVGYLRSKIDKVTGESYISTVRGAGFMFKEPE